MFDISYWSMAQRPSGQNCKFLLSLNSQKRLRYKENNTKYRSLTWKPQSHVRILIYQMLAIQIICQGSKLTLANSQNASDFDKLCTVYLISTRKRLRVRIIHVSQTFWKNLLMVSLVGKILLAKLCKWTVKLTSSPYALNVIAVKCQSIPQSTLNQHSTDTSRDTVLTLHRHLGWQSIIKQMLIKCRWVMTKYR